MNLRTIRDLVADTASDQPVLQAWIDRAVAISPAVAEALEGVWCGRDGVHQTEPLSDLTREHCIVVGWHSGRVEYAYVS